MTVLINYHFLLTGDVFLGRWHGADVSCVDPACYMRIITVYSQVAIKVSKAITKKEQGDFLNEIHVMRQLRQHPHIVSLLGM